MECVLCESESKVFRAIQLSRTGDSLSPEHAYFITKIPFCQGYLPIGAISRPFAGIADFALVDAAWTGAAGFRASDLTEKSSQKLMHFRDAGATIAGVV